MTKISALSPGGFTIELTCPDDEHDPVVWLLTQDMRLQELRFKPLPVPSYGGGGNRGGNNNTPRNWIEAEGNNLYIYFAWSGKDKAENDANKKAWLDKIKEATGIIGIAEHELFGQDAKGRDIWTYVYPITKGRELLEVLPADQFERKPKLADRLAKAQKDK